MYLDIKKTTPLHAKEKAGSVSSAINSMYKDKGFEMEINWNGFKIPIDGISLSFMYIEITMMLKDFFWEEESFSAFFLVSNFTVEWQFEVDSDNLKIDAFWTTAAGRFDGEEKVYLAPEMNDLKELQTIVMRKADFIYEWKKLLEIVRKDLKFAGYDNSLSGYEDLDYVLNNDF